MLSSSSSSDRLRALLRERKVIVCCGAGGVGKTTTAAALAVVAATAGRRVLVLTIDPARRLAQAMGIRENTREPAPLAPEALRAAGIKEGQLDAWMLNPDVVFEEMVRRLATDADQADRILESRLFRLLSTMASGMQEYTAAEALYTLSTSGRYDLVVLDTPPARNALDFLEAPGRLSRFLDERILSLFLPGEKKRFVLWRKTTELIGGVFTRVFGPEFYEEMQQFLGAFGGMFGPMRQHAIGVRTLLGSPEAAFLLVTSPEQAALSEARFFKEKILSMGLPFTGLLLNKSWARAETLPGPAALGASTSTSGKLTALAEIERSRVERDATLLAQLSAELPPGAFAVAAPYVGESIEDLAGLAAFARGFAG